MKEYFDKLVKDFLDFKWVVEIVKSLGSIILVFVICYIAYRFITWILTKYVVLVKGDMHQKRAQTINILIRSFMRYVFAIIAIIFSLQYVGLNPQTIFAGAGVVGIVIGFAFQDLLKDIVAGFFIIFERSISVGDLVEINGIGGTINFIGIKTTTFVAYTGEKIIFNNRDINRIINFSMANYSFSINKITIANSNDFNKFKEVFNKNLPTYLEKYPQILDNPVIKGIDSLGNGYYTIEIHTKVKPLAQYQFRRDFNIELLKLIQENKIDTAQHIIKDEA